MSAPISMKGSKAYCLGCFRDPRRKNNVGIATMRDLLLLPVQIEGLAAIIAAGKNCVLGSAPGINLWRAYPVRNIQCSQCRKVIL